jgi:YbbR domain-containing protein
MNIKSKIKAFLFAAILFISVTHFESCKKESAEEIKIPPVIVNGVN